MLIGRHTHGGDLDIMETMPSKQKFHNVTLLMCIICNILCFAIATTISNFDSETCNTPPKRLWKGRAGKKCQDLRQCTLKVPDHKTVHNQDTTTPSH